MWSANSRLIGQDEAATLRAPISNSVPGGFSPSRFLAYLNDARPARVYQQLTMKS